MGVVVEGRGGRLAGGWVAGGLLAGGWLACGLLAGGWLAGGWLARGWLAGGWLAGGWLAGGWLAGGWASLESWFVGFSRGCSTPVRAGLPGVPMAADDGMAEARDRVGLGDGGAARSDTNISSSHSRPSSSELEGGFDAFPCDDLSGWLRGPLRGGRAGESAAPKSRMPASCFCSVVLMVTPAVTSAVVAACSVTHAGVSTCFRATARCHFTCYRSIYRKMAGQRDESGRRGSKRLAQGDQALATLDETRVRTRPVDETGMGQ